MSRERAQEAGACSCKKNEELLTTEKEPPQQPQTRRGAK